MRISDWSSDVCSSDLDREAGKEGQPATVPEALRLLVAVAGRQAEKPKQPKAPKKTGMDESVVRNGGGAALLRVEGKDRKGLSVKRFHKGATKGGGGGTSEAERVDRGGRRSSKKQRTHPPQETT